MTKAKRIVFFGRTMRGGQGAVSAEVLAKFPDMLEALGLELASKHQSEAGIVEREKQLTPAHIHDRDYRWLKGADLAIFEISNPSLGVGGEISDAVHLGKPVLLLFQGDPDSISAYARGIQGSKFVDSPAEWHEYDSLENAAGIIRAFMKAYL